jgi:hypothetical protein
VRRPGASGPRGAHVWAVVRDQEALEWWFDDGNMGEWSGNESSQERERMEEELGSVNRGGDAPFIGSGEGGRATVAGVTVGHQ